MLRRIAIASLLLLSSGCSKSELLGFAAFVGFVIAVPIVLAIGGFIGSVIGEMIQDYQKGKAETLARAPQEYNEATRELKGFVGDCAYIVRRDVTRGVAFRPGSGSRRARERSMALIRRARERVDRLFEHAPDRRLYDAQTELARLETACSQCEELNKEADTAKCRALAREEVEEDVDLEFRELDEEEGQG